MSPNSPNDDQAAPGLRPEAEEDAAVGVPGYLLRLGTQADRLQARLDAMMADVQSGGEQIAVLTRYLADPSREQGVEERLAELAAGLDTTQGRFDELARQVSDLSASVARLARTQFKGNALAESKDQQVGSALAALQEIVERREEIRQANVEREQARAAELRAEGRSELAVEMLPGLDGLEMALESGRALLAEQRRRQAEEAALASAGPAAPPESAWRRLRRSLVGEAAPFALAERAPQPDADACREQYAALEGWLRGLDLVHGRFLALLALEDIRPVGAPGEAFDPRLHQAVEADDRAGAPPGTVVRVLRKGYRLRDRVLRYAEVAVSRAPREAGGNQ